MIIDYTDYTTKTYQDSTACPMPTKNKLATRGQPSTYPFTCPVLPPNPNVYVSINADDKWDEKANIIAEIPNGLDLCEKISEDLGLRLEFKGISLIHRVAGGLSRMFKVGSSQPARLLYMLAMRNQTRFGRRLKVYHDGAGGTLGTILVDLTDDAPLSGQQKKALADAIASIPGLYPPLDIMFQKNGPVENPGSRSGRQENGPRPHIRVPYLIRTTTSDSTSGSDIAVKLDLVRSMVENYRYVYAQSERTASLVNR